MTIVYSFNIVILYWDAHFNVQDDIGIKKMYNCLTFAHTDILTHTIAHI